MMNIKISKPENTPLLSSTEWKQEIEGEDVPFGPPPEEYSYPIAKTYSTLVQARLLVVPAKQCGSIISTSCIS